MRSMLRANASYAIGTSANGVALFVLVPYLVRTLTPEDYGVWTLSEVSILIFNLLMLAGLDVGLMREYWSQPDETLRRNLAGSVFIAVMAWGTLLAGIAALLLFGLAGQTLGFTSSTVVLVLVIAWTETAFALFLAMFRIREASRTFVALSTGRMAAFVFMSIALTQASHGLAGALYGRLLGTIIALIPASVLCRRFLTLHVDRAALARVVRYGLPLLPTNVAIYFLFAADRYVLGRLASLEAVAVYAFAYKAASTLDLIVTRSFATDWAPRRFKIAAEPDAPRKYAFVLLFFLWVGLGFGLFVLAITPVVYAWLAPAVYHTGMSTVPILLLAYLIYGLSYPLNTGIMLRDKTGYLPFLGWLAAAACVGLDFWWIPTYGITGAAWATLVSYTIWTATLTWVSLRLYPVPYSLREIGWVAMTALAGYGGLLAIEHIGASDALTLLPARLAWVAVLVIYGGYRLRRRYRSSGGVALWRAAESDRRAVV